MTKGKYFLKSRAVDLLVLVLVVVMIMAFSHYWIADRLALRRAIYPFEAGIAHLKTKCSDQAPAWLKEMIGYAIDEQYSLSNQVAYIDSHGALYRCESGGEEDVFSSPDVSATTRFRFASLTKLLTASAVLDQINAGHLSLDTRLMDLFPELRPVADQRLESITITHLLSHSSGFDRLRQMDVLTKHNAKPWCPSHLESLRTLHLVFEPGERYSYSNIGYCLLGAVLERVTQKPFRATLEAMYGLSARGLVFVNGPYLSDEVSYDFRNSEFYTEDYYRHFDFSALSSSMGLSGNAVALATVLKENTTKRPFNLTSLQPRSSCDASQYDQCYGAAVSYYQQHGEPLTLYIQSGYMFGTATLAFIDSRGGVFVWLGSGAPLQPRPATENMVKLAYSLQAASTVSGR